MYKRQEEDGADTVTCAEELPVSGRAGADARGGLTEALGHGQRGDDHLAGGGCRHAYRILLAANFDHRHVAALRGGQEDGGKRPMNRRGSGDAFVLPWSHAGLARSERRPEIRYLLAILVVDHNEATV